jgi:cell division protein FtsB
LEKEMINRSEYPKWIGDKLARSEEEEETVLSEQVAAAEAENAKLQAKKDAESK